MNCAGGGEPRHDGLRSAGMAFAANGITTLEEVVRETILK
jgi:hypothetical protein